MARLGHVSRVMTQVHNILCVHVQLFSHVQIFVVLLSISCQAPLSRNSPGKNTGVGCHFLLQGTFPTQGPNSWLLHLLHWQVDFLQLHYLGSPT